MNKYIVLIDAYSSGNFLPGYYRAAGFKLIHLQSTPQLLPRMLPPVEGHYDIWLPYFASMSEAVASLKEYDIEAITAGQESGVYLADVLSEQLTPQVSNGSELSQARRDKFRMIERVNFAGLSAAQQFKSTSPDEVGHWAEHQGGFPCVVKPLSSASSDGVTICQSTAEVVQASQQVLSSRDIFGVPNYEVLCQSFLRGTEYIVDTVSRDGANYICGIWRYSKKLVNGKNLYDKDILVDPQSSVALELISYSMKVLQALNIRNGPAHAEIIVTSDGPALVEIGARLNGNMHPLFHDKCIGANQAEVTAIAYCNPKLFYENYAGQVYKKTKVAYVVSTSTNNSGKIVGVDESVVHKLERCPGVFHVNVKLSPGKLILPTTDLLTSPLRIFICDEDERLVERAYDYIQRLKDRVYIYQ